MSCGSRWIGESASPRSWTACQSTGFFFAFCVENDPDILYTPANAQSHADKKYYRDTWGDGARYPTIMYDGDGANVLGSEALLEMLDAHEALVSHSHVFEGVLFGG